MDDVTSKLRTFQSDNGITDIHDMKALLGLTQLMKKQNFHLDSEKAMTYLFDSESEYEYSDMRPFRLNFDSNISIRAVFDDLFAEAKQRQENNKNVSYREILLRHLAEAALLIVLPHRMIQIHNTSVADSPTDRSGDFVINNTILHCTTAPGDPLIQKCAANIRSGCQPIIITIFERVRTAFDLVITEKGVLIEKYK
jgi:hypothetical protein